MGDLTKKTSNSIAEKAAVNTDGKGLNGFMLDWYATTPRDVVVKPQRQVLSEFFTSMLVLSANFKYKPVVGVSNFLYLIDDQWSLSLISPNEWSEERRAGYVGRCELQSDMTWTIEPSENLVEGNVVAEGVRRFYKAFAETLDTDLTLEEILPFYVGRMPYYQRLYASAMSRSVRRSVKLSGDDPHSCRDWLGLLPRVEQVLLPANSL